MLNIPEFVFVCGAVGSGNSFMFRCLIQDPNVYGINEDALGSLLYRLLNSPSKPEEFSHYIDAYLNFMQALRGNRKTLVLKTPSNIRHAAEIKEHLPASKFIVMIREPHAAVVSGLSRHRAGVEKVVRTWLADYQYLQTFTKDSLVINYADFINNPNDILQEVHNEIIPLSAIVFRYAEKSSITQNADRNRWRILVDTKTEKEVERWVEKLHLEQAYHSVLTEFVYE